MGTLLDDTECKILLDCGSIKNFMSKQYYHRNKSFHGLPKFISKNKAIQVGNGASVKILLISHINITIQGHVFQINTMVSEIHDNICLIEVSNHLLS